MVLRRPPSQDLIVSVSPPILYVSAMTVLKNIISIIIECAKAKEIILIVAESKMMLVLVVVVVVVGEEWK